MAESKKSHQQQYFGRNVLQNNNKDHVYFYQFMASQIFYKDCILSRFTISQLHIFITTDYYKSRFVISMIF